MVKLINQRTLRAGRVLLVVALLLASHAAAAITILNVGTFARWGSGNSIADEDGVSGAFAQPGSTPLAQVLTTDLDVSAIANVNIASGQLGLASQWAVTSGVAENSLVRFVASGANIVYVDTLTVQSATLPVNTPVQIQFSFTVASTTTASHLSPSGGNNASDPKAVATASFQSLTDGTHFLSANDHNAVKNTGDGTNIALGLLAAPNMASIVVDTHVGDQFNFSLSPGVGTNGGPGNNALFSTQNFAFANLGIGFGAAVVSHPDEDIDILSELLAGNPFPTLAAATAENAVSALPTAIPLPAPLLLLGATLPILIRRRHARLAGR